MGTRVAVSAEASSTSAILTITWGGTQPTPGNKVVVGFWFSGGVPTVNSVKDNGSAVSTFSLVVTDTLTSSQGFSLYYADNITLPVAGSYQVVVTCASSPGTLDGGGIAYSGLAAGNATVTNHGQNTPGGTTASSGSIAPTGSGAYVGGVTDNTGANPATLTAGGGFTNQVTQTNGSSAQAGALADIPAGSGTKTASWTIDSAIWDAVVAFWPDGAAGPVVLPQIAYAYGPN